MRHAIAALILTAGLAVTVEAGAMGKPGPVTCPDDAALALAEACPCAGKAMPDGSVLAWKNHGQYVSCVVRLRNKLRKAGCLTDDAKRSIARCAARSTCGKADVVLCCSVEETGTCNDPMPGDLVAAGVCSNDALLPCDTDVDCTKTRAAVAKDEAACVAAGGAVVPEGGSVCEVCSPPAP
jgi:hypothetical protein